MFFDIVHIVQLLVLSQYRTRGMCHVTYEEGRSFAESQSPDWSSRMRELRCRKQDEVDTAPECWSHNQRCLGRKRVWLGTDGSS